MNKVWAVHEEEYVRQNAAFVSDENGAIQLSAIVGRKITTHSWRKKRQELGLRKQCGRGVCKLYRDKEE